MFNLNTFYKNQMIEGFGMLGVPVGGGGGTVVPQIVPGITSKDVVPLWGQESIEGDLLEALHGKHYLMHDKYELDDAARDTYYSPHELVSKEQAEAWTDLAVHGTLLAGSPTKYGALFDLASASAAHLRGKEELRNALALGAFIPTFLPKSMSFKNQTLDKYLGLNLYNKYIAPKYGDDIVRDVIRGSSGVVDDAGRVVSGNLGEGLSQLFSKQVSMPKLLTRQLSKSVGSPLVIKGKTYNNMTEAFNAGEEIYVEYNKQLLKKNLLSDESYYRFLNQFEEGIKLQKDDLRELALSDPWKFNSMFQDYIKTMDQGRWSIPKGWQKTNIETGDFKSTVPYKPGYDFETSQNPYNFVEQLKVAPEDKIHGAGFTQTQAKYSEYPFKLWKETNVDKQFGEFYGPTNVKLLEGGDLAHADKMIKIMDDIVGNVTDRNAYNAAVTSSLENMEKILFAKPSGSVEQILDDAGAFGVYYPKDIDVDRVINRPARSFNKDDWMFNKAHSDELFLQLNEFGDSKIYNYGLKKIAEDSKLGPSTTLYHELKHLIQDDITNLLTPGYNIFNLKMFGKTLNRGVVPKVWKDAGALTTTSHRNINFRGKPYRIPFTKKQVPVDENLFYSSVANHPYTLTPQGMATVNLINKTPILSKNIGSLPSAINNPRIFRLFGNEFKIPGIKQNYPVDMADIWYEHRGLKYSPLELPKDVKFPPGVVGRWHQRPHEISAALEEGRIGNPTYSYHLSNEVTRFNELNKALDILDKAVWGVAPVAGSQLIEEDHFSVRPR